VKAPPTSQQADVGSSHILGGGKHHFPFSHKTYSRRTKRLAKPRVFMEYQQPETTKAFEDLTQCKEPIPEITPHASRSSEDNISKYIILI